MKIKILGKVWDFEKASPVLNENGEEVRGICDSPTTKFKKILVEQSLSDQEELEVILHEIIHAAMFLALSEEIVEQLGEDFSKILFKQLKYRKLDDNFLNKLYDLSIKADDKEDFVKSVNEYL